VPIGVASGSPKTLQVRTLSMMHAPLPTCGRVETRFVVLLSECPVSV
jgi:hypothetical protein